MSGVREGPLTVWHASGQTTLQDVAIEKNEKILKIKIKVGMVGYGAIEKQEGSTQNQIFYSGEPGYLT